MSFRWPKMALFLPSCRRRYSLEVPLLDSEELGEGRLTEHPAELGVRR